MGPGGNGPRRHHAHAGVFGLLVSVERWAGWSSPVRSRDHDGPGRPVDADQVWLPAGDGVQGIDGHALAGEGAAVHLNELQSTRRFRRPRQPQPVEHRKVMVAGPQGVAMAESDSLCLGGGMMASQLIAGSGAKRQFNGQFRGKTLLSDLFLTRYTLREIPLRLARWATGAECSLFG